MKKYLVSLSVILLLLAPGADAALTEFRTFTAEGANISIDAVGALTGGGSIQADIPETAIIEAAYLYSATVMDFPYSTRADVNFDGNDLELSSGARVDEDQKDANGAEETRWDVTSIVQSRYDANPGGVIDFTVAETGFLEGEILAVLYSIPSQPVQTAFIFDGELDTAGDSFNININGFDGSYGVFSLGISHGFQSTGVLEQFTQVEVNSARLTTSAGGQDDGDDFDGGLITVGGVGDLPDNPLDPFAFPEGDPRDDDELYDISQFLNNGDNLITTTNPSGDDNVFFAALVVSGEASVGPGTDPGPAPVPEPATVLLLSTGLLGIFARLQRKR